MTTPPVLTIEAGSLQGINFASYITDFFDGLGAGTNEFYGGTPDYVFGGAYNVSGSQILTTYAEAAEIALIDGETLAYDFLHYGSSYGHGISGTVESLTFGAWIEGETTGTPGTGAAGRVAGVDEGLVLDGFDLSAAPGAGFDPAVNQVYALYSALRDKAAGAIYDLISGYTLDVTGSARQDVLIGYAGDDTVFGGGGNDKLSGNGGADLLRGGGGSDVLQGGNGADELLGGTGNDHLFGSFGADVRAGGVGADRLSGGLGADTFVFAAGDGHDLVLDFNVAQDRIDLSGFELEGFGDLGLADVGSAARLTVDDVTIDLRGVEVGQLDVDQFIF
jgi:Ca2+-binding RTX toxin-like protein